MASDLSRREALKAVLSAGTVAMMQPAFAMTPDSPLGVRSGPVELTVTPVSRKTVRITMRPLRDGNPVALEPDGALAAREWPAPVAQLRSLSKPLTVQSGALTITVSPDPVKVLIRKSGGRLLQELAIDEISG